MLSAACEIASNFLTHAERRPTRPQHIDHTHDLWEDAKLLSIQMTKADECLL